VEIHVVLFLVVQCDALCEVCKMGIGVVLRPTRIDVAADVFCAVGDAEPEEFDEPRTCLGTMYTDSLQRRAVLQEFADHAEAPAGDGGRHRQVEGPHVRQTQPGCEVAVAWHLELQDLQLRERHSRERTCVDWVVKREEGEVADMEGSMAHERLQQPPDVDLAALRRRAHRVAAVTGKLRRSLVADEHVLCDPQLRRGAVEHLHESGDRVGAGDGNGMKSTQRAPAVLPPFVHASAKIGASSSLGSVSSMVVAEKDK
jgi:hypothetical protein